MDLRQVEPCLRRSGAWASPRGDDSPPGALRMLRDNMPTANRSRIERPPPGRRRQGWRSYRSEACARRPKWQATVSGANLVHFGSQRSICRSSHRRACRRARMQVTDPARAMQVAGAGWKARGFAGRPLERPARCFAAQTRSKIGEVRVRRVVTDPAETGVRWLHRHRQAESNVHAQVCIHRDAPNAQARRSATGAAERAPSLLHRPDATRLQHRKSAYACPPR